MEALSVSLQFKNQGQPLKHPDHKVQRPFVESPLTDALRQFHINPNLDLYIRTQVLIHRCKF